MVPKAGLEPARLTPLPPQDSVSTNSTTWAKTFSYQSSESQQNVAEENYGPAIDLQLPPTLQLELAPRATPSRPWTLPTLEGQKLPHHPTRFQAQV